MRGAVPPLPNAVRHARVEFAFTSYVQEIILRKCTLKTLKIQVSGQYCGIVLICEHIFHY